MRVKFEEPPFGTCRGGIIWLEDILAELPVGFSDGTVDNPVCTFWDEFFGDTESISKDVSLFAALVLLSASFHEEDPFLGTGLSAALYENLEGKYSEESNLVGDLTDTNSPFKSCTVILTPGTILESYTTPLGGDGPFPAKSKGRSRDEDPGASVRLLYFPSTPRFNGLIFSPSV